MEIIIGALTSNVKYCFVMLWNMYLIRKYLCEYISIQLKNCEMNDMTKKLPFCPDLQSQVSLH